jgi:hypothetical protein
MSMIKITKIKPRDWHPNFGYGKAAYGIADHTEIRIVRDSLGWRAYGLGQNLMADTRPELETHISYALNNRKA